MKKVIEFFMWQYEGEYEQYFYVTDNEEEFVKEVINYLEEVQCKKQFPWSNTLVGFKPLKQVQIDFMDNNIVHLSETYFLDFKGYGTNRFSVEKRVTTFKTEKFI